MDAGDHERGRDPASGAGSGTLLRAATRWPTGLFLALVALGTLVRLATDTAPGPRLVGAVLGKAIVLGLVAGVTVALGHRLVALGFGRTGIGRALQPVAVSVAAVGAALLVALGAALAGGADARLVVVPVDPRSGATGGLALGLAVLAGLAVNSLAEEGLFRGLGLRLGGQGRSFWRANAIQAGAFGAWHLLWPAAAVAGGPAASVPGGPVTPGAFGPTPAVAALLAAVGATTAGLVLGYAAHVTGSLWAPVGIHTVYNVGALFVHVEVAGRLDPDPGVRGAALAASYGAVLVALWVQERRRGAAGFPAWDSG